MKLNFGRRLILFVHWLASVLVMAAVVFSEFTARYTELLKGWIGEDYAQLALYVFAALYALLSVFAVWVIFHRDGKRSERGFITVDSSETGRVRISVGAIEQMVKQAVCAVDGIADMRIGIHSDDDAITINVAISILSGAHVPTVTLNMQRAIRQFVEMNCGVAVRSVSISVQTIVNPQEPGKRGKRAELKSPVPAHGHPEPEPGYGTGVESPFADAANAANFAPNAHGAPVEPVAPYEPAAPYEPIASVAPSAPIANVAPSAPMDEAPPAIDVPESSSYELGESFQPIQADEEGEATYGDAAKDE